MNMQEPQQLFVLAQSKWWLGLTDRLAYKPNRNLERVKTYHHPGVPEWIAFPRFCKDHVHSKAAETTLELRITMPSSPACRPCKISPPWMSCAPIRPERWPPPRWASIWKRFGLPRRMEPWKPFYEKSGESLQESHGVEIQGSVLICLLRRAEWLGKSQGGVSSVSGVELSDRSKMGWRGWVGNAIWENVQWTHIH